MTEAKDVDPTFPGLMLLFVVFSIPSLAVFFMWVKEEQVNKKLPAVLTCYLSLDR